MRQLPRVVILSASLLVLLMGCAKETKPDAEQPQVQVLIDREETVSAAVPKGVTLRDADHAEFRKVLASHKGKVVFVDFWGTWCGNCMEEFPKTVELANQHKDDGLVVISLAMELDPTDAETRKQVQDFLVKQNATFENLIYPEDGTTQEATDGFNIGEFPLPHYQLFDRDGNLIQKFTFSDPNNPITSEEIAQAVAAAVTK